MESALHHHHLLQPSEINHLPHLPTKNLPTNNLHLIHLPTNYFLLIHLPTNYFQLNQLPTNYFQLNHQPTNYHHLILHHQLLMNHIRSRKDPSLRCGLPAGSGPP